MLRAVKSSQPMNEAKQKSCRASWKAKSEVRAGSSEFNLQVVSSTRKLKLELSTTRLSRKAKSELRAGSSEFNLQVVSFDTQAKA